MKLVHNDIKRTLAYSTIGQMGYMIMECGLGAFSLAIFHLIAHGLFKASTFLNCGNVIHETRQEPKRPYKPTESGGLGAMNWAIGFFLSLALPLVIVYFAHELLNVPLRESQGLVIFLFFSWVTASQAMLTLYRLRGSDSFKLQGILLLVVAVVTLIYLFAAEVFTSFLYPSSETVISYFAAAALPNGLFWTIVVIAAAVITIGWAVAYTKRQGRAVNRPQPIRDLRTSLYVLFINRLYLDGMALRLQSFAKRVVEGLDRNQFFLPGAALFAIAVAGSRLSSFADASLGTTFGLLVIGLLLPLFPFHFVYVAALKRLRGVAAIVVSAALPLAGLFGLTMLPGIPPSLQPVVSALALVGAIYASLKALVQRSVSHLIAYAGLAFYSILWWQVASIGSVTPEAITYTIAVVLVIGGTLMAWARLRIRYGDLPINRIGGLARPMPRFGLCLALLVMAAVGLPPFGLAFSFIGLILSAPVVTTGTFVVLLTWFGASWYLFRLMQRLLFGPHRQDLRYDDLKPGEVAAFVGVLLLLIGLSAVPLASLTNGAEEAVARVVMETK